MNNSLNDLPVNAYIYQKPLWQELLDIFGIMLLLSQQFKVGVCPPTY